MGERKLSQLVEATWGITDFIGHFEIEQLFKEGCSFCVWEDVSELGEAQVATVADDVENFASERGYVFLFEVEGLLDGNRLAGRLPVHGIEEVLSTGNQACTVEADEAIATVAAIVGDTPWKSENIAPVVEGDGSCDEGAAFLLALSYENCISKTCDDAIASKEVASFERGTGDILCEETTSLLDHLFGNGTVIVGIDAVQTVSHYSESWNAVFESGFVGLHIDAKRQTTDDDQVGKYFVQIVYETMHHVASVLCALSCADNAEDVLRFEVDVTKLEKNGGSIRTTHEALWVTFLAIDERLDVMGFDEGKFTFGIDAVLRVVTAIDDHLADSTCLEKKAGVGIEDSFGAAECIDEMTGSDGAYATDGVQNKDGE